MIRAALVLTAGGVIGAFGACKDSSSPTPPPPPPPPPPPLSTPTGLTATPTGTTGIDLAWTYTDATVTGFRLDRCSGAGCTNFAQVGSNLAGTARTSSDANLTANTPYSYRIRAIKGADTSAWSSTASATTGAVSASITMIGAGEITTCGSVGTSQTAELIQNQVTADPNTIVFTAGNNLAASAGAGNYSTCFDPTWGKFKANMRAALGNMDFSSTNSDAPYQYFGDAAGPVNKGYYSFDAGSWHIIVLNTTTETATVNTCTWSDDNSGGLACAGKPHPELDWLASDLAANTKPCLMAIAWERRLYTASNGALGRNANLNAAAEMLFGAGLDILVSAKDQLYERFPKLDYDGAPNDKGFAQFVVGTGGRSLAAMHAPTAGNPVKAQYGAPSPFVSGWTDSWGVIQFKLNDNSYEWKFVGTDAARFSDASTTPVACN
jgi:hypothetical protein